MSDSYTTFHHQLIKQWAKNTRDHAPFHRLSAEQLERHSEYDIHTFDDEQSDATYLQQLLTLANDEIPNRNLGQWLVTRAISHYPSLVAIIPRDLLWFFGGDCMHFLGDEEIEQFQRLDEIYFASENTRDYASLRHEHQAKLN